MKNLSIVIIMILSQISLFAQLSGTKSIGGTGADYATISAAVSALSSSGVNGALTFNIATGTYTEQFTIGSVSGASAINTITFQSAANDSSLVIINSSSSTSNPNNYVIKYNAAKYITFKDVTIERTGSNSYSTVIEVVGVTNNNSFENCVIKNGAIASTTNFTSLVYITNGSINNASSYSFFNNSFVNGSFAIYYFGISSASLSTSNSITYNTFLNQGRTAINLKYHDAPIINNNIIISNSSYYNFSAIEVQYCKNGMQIMNNKITAVKKYGINLGNSSGQTLAGLVANNFISLSGSGAVALSYNNSGSHNIYYNSINVFGSTSTGLYVSGQNSNNLRFQNNSIKVGTSGKCMNILNGNFPFLNSNYNNYYFPTGNMGTWGSTTNISSLATWKTTTNLDYSSVNLDPSYTSNTNLYIVSPSLISKKGSSAMTTPSVSVDIDGKVRNSITPDIGAHEFTTEDLSVSDIITLSAYCKSETEIVQFKLSNNGNTPFVGNVDVSYQLGSGAVITQTFTIANIAVGAFEQLTFTTPLIFSTIGTSNLEVKHLYADSDPSNDLNTKSITVNQAPVINWANDTLVCSISSVTLDAGAGMTSYLWSTGETTQTINIDSSGIGLGAKYFKVVVELNTCSTSDSILVNFIYCTGIDGNIENKSISIYPNPSNGIFYINDNKSTIENVSIEVLNNMGQIVFETILEDNRLDLTSIKAGYYFVRINTNNGFVIKPIIIN